MRRGERCGGAHYGSPPSGSCVALGPGRGTPDIRLGLCSRAAQSLLLPPPPPGTEASLDPWAHHPHPTGDNVRGQGAASSDCAVWAQRRAQVQIGIF